MTGMSSDFHPEYFETRFRTDQPVDSWPDDFVIVTAYATSGETWSDEENAAADRALDAELRQRGGWLVRITGYSPTSGHAEPGWAFEMSLPEAIALGQRFKQDAIWSVENGALTVVKCEGGARASVATFGARIDEVTARDAVDIKSRDYWFKIVEFLQQNWALIDETEEGVTVWFVQDDSGVFDQMAFATAEEAAAALRRNGFDRLADDAASQEFIAPPQSPFERASHPSGRIYSSGRFWRR